MHYITSINFIFLENAIEKLASYYSELIDTLGTTDLLPHFVSKRIITIDDEELISSAPTNKEKARKLLRIISSQLEAGYTKSMEDLLEIMKTKGNIAIVDLAAKIESETKPAQARVTFE